MLSYWEQQSFIHYDHIIIGAGIVGLSLAIELREKYPDRSVLVLERGLLPTGASTRNAGFACMGSVTELLDDLETMDERTVLELFDLRKRGLELLRSQLGDATIGYKAEGSYELISEAELPALNKIDHLNRLLQPITKTDAFSICNEQIALAGFSSAHTKAIIQNNCEGSIHTGKMMRALSLMAMQKGVETKTGADVARIDEQDTHIDVVVHDAARNEAVIFTTEKLIYCTNAFTPALLSDVDIQPGRGQVLITKPIPGLRFKGIYHFDKGYYYFREVDGRVLFGGGRNLDIEGESTTEFALTERIQKGLEQKLREIILPGQDFEIDMRWSGIMAFGADKQPIVKQLTERSYGAFRMGGMGVAIGSMVAREVKELIIKNE